MIMQVQAEGLEASVQELQVRLQRAQEDLVLKRQTVEGLTHKFDRYPVHLVPLCSALACW